MKLWYQGTPVRVRKRKRASLAVLRLEFPEVAGLTDLQLRRWWDKHFWQEWIIEPLQNSASSWPIGRH